jgi:hypothetical protein
MFGGSDDEDFEDDGPMFGGADRYEERARKMERAKEIASGLVSGMMETDEEVWELVKELQENK